MRCRNGHESQALDYCDTCGEAMPAEADAAEAAAAAASPPADLAGAPPAPGPVDGQTCPSCGTLAGADALFCESCGYDFTTGSMPRRESAATPAAPEAAASGPANTSTTLNTPWVAEVWVDPEWYASQQSPDQLPSAGLPTVIALRNSSLLIGRFSRSRDIHPDIDCGADNGVSRRHAQLTTDGRRWWIEDLQSANGTFIGDAVGDLPDAPIPVGSKREVDADDRIYLGSWTRIVIRPAEEGEV